MKNIVLYTCNCPTLREDIKLKEQIMKLENEEWNVIGLSEIRRKDKRLIDLDDNMKLYLNGAGSYGIPNK